MLKEVSETSILDGYLTKQQLANELGLAPRTLDRMEELRQGPPRTVIGKTILFKKTSVLEWLESKEVRRECRTWKRNR